MIRCKWGEMGSQPDTCPKQYGFLPALGAHEAVTHISVQLIDSYVQNICDQACSKSEGELGAESSTDSCNEGQIRHAHIKKKQINKKH